MKRFFNFIFAALFLALLLLPLAACTEQTPKEDDYTPDFSGEALSAGEVRMNVYGGTGYLRWGDIEGATAYRISRSQTLYGQYTSVEDGVEATAYEAQEHIYDYYRVAAVVGGKTVETEPVSAFSNTLVVGPNDDMAAVQSHIDRMHAALETGATGQFSDLRFAIILLPGSYPDLDVKLGYYTTVSGAGETPYNVVIGSLYVSTNVLANQNATCTFWRGAENLTVNGNTRWAVSQATSLRRIRINGNLTLSGSGDGAWSSGGFLANSEITGTVNPGSQQQWMSRNDVWSSWSHCNSHNYVFAGCEGSVPTGLWAESGVRSTVLNTTERIAEKPFLVYDAANGYRVFVPAAEKDTAGVTWESGLDYEYGYFLSLDEFYVANECTDTAETLNAALKAGKHLFFPPGHYKLDRALEVTQAESVVMGLGYATLEITDRNQDCALRIADVDGIRLADILVEAGTYSKNMVVVGEAGKHASHANDPIVLSNIYLRIGGVKNVHTETDTAMVIYANDTIGDNFWIWRADHTLGTAWEDTENEDGSVSYGNPVKTGLLVEGDNVACYALMVEHCEGYQTDWRGEGGLVVMYQSETPYKVPSQEKWMSRGTKMGCASYHVADEVLTHRAYGIGVYLVNSSGVILESAIETPETAGILLEHLVTCCFTAEKGSAILNVVNDLGEDVRKGISRRLVEHFPL